MNSTNTKTVLNPWEKAQNKLYFYNLFAPHGVKFSSVYEAERMSYGLAKIANKLTDLELLLLTNKIEDILVTNRRTNGR